MRTLILGLMATLFLLPSTAGAYLLDLSPTHYPLVYSNAITINYYDLTDPARPPEATPGKGYFVASGWSAQYTTDRLGFGPVVDLEHGSFTLTAVIDPNTGAAESGTLYVTGDPNGDIPIPGDPSGTMVDMFQSARLTAFAYDPLVDKFEFIFLQDGAGMQADPNEPVGVILSGYSINGNNSYDFTQSFVNNYNGDSYTYFLPEPSAAVLLSVAAVGLIRRRRK